ncbi:MAG: co-chaperone GroES [Dehalococcoidia bacterium]|nr:co-chaperone GroES [Dehalococcoidia bacterium]
MTIRIASVSQLMPMADRLVVRPAKQEDVTKSGIFIPDSAQERPQEGVVVAVGPGRYSRKGKRVAVGIKAGDKVIYSKYAGTEIEVEDEELLVIGANDVLAKIS